MPVMRDEHGRSVSGGSKKSGWLYSLGIGCHGKGTMDVRRLKRKLDKGKMRGVSDAARYIRKAMMNLLRKRAPKRKPSKPGSPPHRHSSRGLAWGVLYSVDRRAGSAVIGPDYFRVKYCGMKHEKGGMFKGAHYPRRPFAGPALKKTRSRLPRFWQASVR